MSWLSDITNDIAAFLKPVDDFVNSVISTYIWYIAFVFLILFGIFVLWKFKGAQFVTVREQAKHINPVGNVEVGKKEKNHRITSFQAFCVGLGARVGIGNITGVTSAIIMGGAGAVFWMWIFALIGAGTSLVECTLGQMFKEKKEDGHFHGGPAYYILKGMKNNKFALFIAFWIILAYGIGFNANQAANVSSAFVKLPAFADIGAEAMSVVMAFIIAGLTAILIFGGIRRIAKASEVIVPVMVLLWLVIGVIVIIIGWNNLGWALGQIFENAFNWQQIFAGFAGSCIMWGLKRGVYSNESGIGSMPNVASQADVSHPVKQGIVQAAGVYMDTLVVCSITAFMVLTCLPATATHGGWSSIWGSSDKGTSWAMSVVQDSMANALGGTWVLYLLAIMIFVFAFSSLIANYAVAEGNIRFMKDNQKTIQIFRVILVIIVFLACIVPIDLVWDLCDVFMAITAISNIVALCFLWKYARVAWMDWKAQKKAGVEEPVFDVDKVDTQGLDMSGVTEWHAKQ